MDTGPPEKYLKTKAVMAFLFVLWITLIVGTVVLVGAGNVAPRAAALLMLAPSSILGLLAAAYRPTRNLFSRLFIIG